VAIARRGRKPGQCGDGRHGAQSQVECAAQDRRRSRPCVCGVCCCGAITPSMYGCRSVVKVVKRPGEGPRSSDGRGGGRGHEARASRVSLVQPELRSGLGLELRSGLAVFRSPNLSTNPHNNKPPTRTMAMVQVVVVRTVRRRWRRPLLAGILPYEILPGRVRAGRWAWRHGGS